MDTIDISRIEEFRSTLKYQIGDYVKIDVTLADGRIALMKHVGLINEPINSFYSDNIGIITALRFYSSEFLKDKICKDDKYVWEEIKDKCGIYDVSFPVDITKNMSFSETELILSNYDIINF